MPESLMWEYKFSPSDVPCEVRESSVRTSQFRLLRCSSAIRAGDMGVASSQQDDDRDDAALDDRLSLFRLLLIKALQNHTLQLAWLPARSTRTAFIVARVVGVESGNWSVGFQRTDCGFISRETWKDCSVLLMKRTNPTRYSVYVRLQCWCLNTQYIIAGLLQDYCWAYSKIK